MVEFSLFVAIIATWLIFLYLFDYLKKEFIRLNKKLDYLKEEFDKRFEEVKG